jgi:hypothetical protein
MLSTVAWPPLTYIFRNSRKARALQCRPLGATQAHRLLSRWNTAFDLRRGLTSFADHTATRPGPLGGGELLSGQVRDEQRERAVQDLGCVARRNGVPQQVLSEAQLSRVLSLTVTLSS